jgi:hypothetical protein
MAANKVLGEILGNLLLFTLCEDLSIWEHLMSIDMPIGTKVELLLPAVYCCQRNLPQQSNGQEKFCNIVISEALEDRFLDLRREVVLQLGLITIGDQG